MFNYNEMGIVNTDLNNFNFDINFDAEDLLFLLLFLSDFWLGI